MYGWDSLGVPGVLAALGSGQLEVVEKLLELKDFIVDFKMEDKHGRTALDYVIMSNSTHYLERILEHLDIGNLMSDGTDMNEMLMPRLITCVEKDKLQHFKEILTYYDLIKDGQLMKFLIDQNKSAFITTTIEFRNFQTLESSD